MKKKDIIGLQRHNQSKINPHWWMKSMCWTRAVLDYVGLLFVQNYLYQIIWLSAILAFRFAFSRLHSGGLLRTYVPGVLTHTRRTSQNLAFLRRSLTTSFILGSRVASLSKAPHGCNAFLLTIRQADYTLKGPLLLYGSMGISPTREAAGRA